MHITLQIQRRGVEFSSYKHRNILMMNELQTHSFSLHKTLFDGLASCGLRMDYCDVLISCLDSPSNGTHSLQRIHMNMITLTQSQISDH